MAHCRDGRRLAAPKATPGRVSDGRWAGQSAARGLSGGMMKMLNLEMNMFKAFVGLAINACQSEA